MDGDLDDLVGPTSALARSPDDTPLPSISSSLSSILSSSTSAASSTPGASILPYTHGLEGVKLSLDKLLIAILWASIGFCTLVILIGRTVQLFNKHQRHLYSLNANSRQQNYWTYDKTAVWPWLKKHVLYAPLGRKRHNREFQITSAINVGTLPSRFHTCLLTVFILSNFAYTLILDYSNPNKASLLAEVRGRSGGLATVNMVPLILFAGRNNPLIQLLNVSFDTFNLFHRWIGRLVIVEAIIHTIAWSANSIAAKGADSTFTQIPSNNFLLCGTIATVAMTIILFQTPSVVRHAAYETFLHLHQVLAFLALIGIYIHLEVAKLPALPFIRVVAGLWAAERVIRIVRIIFLNFSRHNGATQVLVEALPGDACRVTFHLPNHATIRPGSHVYAYLPKISWWMSHPFSVAWTDTASEPATGARDPTCEPSSPSTPPPPLSPSSLEKRVDGESPDQPFPWIQKKLPTSVSLVMAKRTGMTSQLYDAASSAPNKQLVMSGFIEGPYSGHDSLRSYGTVLLFAGGAGITHHLVQIRHLLACSVAGTVATRKIVLVWSVRSVEMLSWVRPWMDEILSMEGRRERLTIKLFVTKPKSPREVVSPSQTVQMFPGRCKPSIVLDDEWPHRVGAVGVSVCGPGAFADEVRDAVRQRMHWGSMDFLEEAFTW
ncbi:MAG: hypothetical protein Q9227_000608 [Pyrenula ochraceoflavens]